MSFPFSRSVICPTCKHVYEVATCSSRDVSRSLPCPDCDFKGLMTKGMNALKQIWIWLRTYFIRGSFCPKCEFATIYTGRYNREKMKVCKRERCEECSWVRKWEWW